MPAVGFVAPSGFLPDPTVLDRAASFFAARNWRVQTAENCWSRHERFAGSDELRVNELQAFCTDRSLDVVIAARGGYGLSRLLDRIDYAAIRKAGRRIVGYSDFTAFNLAYLSQAGGVSFQGPSAGDFGAATPDAFTVEHFFAAMAGDDCEVEFAAGGPACHVKGALWGGNLAMVSALVGTPHMPRVRGGILFLEDVNEPAYKVERMLLQLLHAGVLRRCRALVLGSFDPVVPMPNDNGFSMDSVVAFLRTCIEAPVITGLPFGHVARKLTLPVGARAELAVKESTATLAWRLK